MTPPSVLHEALTALLAGPSPTERSLGFSSALATGSQVCDATITQGIATITLGSALGHATTWSDAALAQLVFTATQFPTVDGVRLLLDGHTVAPAHPSNVLVQQALTRADFEDWSPAVLVESPLVGDTISSPVRVFGSANTFEAVFQIEITDWDGRIVATQRVMATSGTGTRGTFDVTVPYRVTRSGSGELITSVFSAKDGSRIVISETPLQVS